MPGNEGGSRLTVSCGSVELDMKNRWNPLMVGGCNVLGVALLVLSVSAGGPAMRASDDAAMPDSAPLERLMKLADVFQQQVAKIQGSVAAVVAALTTSRVVARELCVADESGAETCITKAQLDALMKTAARVQAMPMVLPSAATRFQAAEAQTFPATETVQVTENMAETGAGEPAACRERCIAPDHEAIAATDPQTPATEPSAAATPEATDARDPAAPAFGEAGRDAAAPQDPPVTDQHEVASEPPAFSVPTPQPMSTGSALRDAAAADTPPPSEHDD